MSIIDHRSILYFRMLREPFDVVRTAFIQRSRVEKDRELDTLLWLEEQGFEEVAVPSRAVVTDDGRPVYRAGNMTLALRKDVFEERREQGLAEAQKREADRRTVQAQEVHESIAATTCPQMVGGKPCGGTLNRAPVCPSCVTGKMGYKYRYTCEGCSFDIVTKTEMQE